MDPAVGSAVPRADGVKQHFEHRQLREWSSTESRQVADAMRYHTVDWIMGKRKNFWEEKDGKGNLAFAIEFFETVTRRHHYRVYVRPADTTNSYEVGRCYNDGAWFLLPDRRNHVASYEAWLEEAMARLSDIAQVRRVMDS